MPLYVREKLTLWMKFSSAYKSSTPRASAIAVGCVLMASAYPLVRPSTSGSRVIYVRLSADAARMIIMSSHQAPGHAHQLRVGNSPWVKPVNLALLIFNRVLLVVPAYRYFQQAFVEKALPHYFHISLLEGRLRLHANRLNPCSSSPHSTKSSGIFASCWRGQWPRFEFPGRKILMTLMDISFCRLARVAGLLYLFAVRQQRLDWASWLYDQDIQLNVAWRGLLWSPCLVTCPFLWPWMIPLMQNTGREDEEAASFWALLAAIIFPPRQPYPI